MVIVGVDDAGRGSLAGSIVYCAFLCREPEKLRRIGAQDSKVTDKAARQVFEKRLKEVDAHYWVSLATPKLVNLTGYYTAEACRIKAITQTVITDLEIDPNAIHFLLDGTAEFTGLPANAKVSYISQGDQKEPLIGAASLLAKLAHDRIMDDTIVPNYRSWGFESHRGYGSPKHLEILYKRGPTKIHRLGPCKTAITNYCKKTGYELPKWLEEYPERR